MLQAKTTSPEKSMGGIGVATAQPLYLSILVHVSVHRRNPGEF